MIRYDMIVRSRSATVQQSCVLRETQASVPMPSQRLPDLSCPRLCEYTHDAASLVVHSTTVAGTGVSTIEVVDPRVSAARKFSLAVPACVVTIDIYLVPRAPSIIINVVGTHALSPQG